MKTLNLEELLLVSGGMSDPQQDPDKQGQADGATNGGSRDPDPESGI